MVEKDSPQPDPERIGGHQIVGCLGEGPRGVVHLGRKSEDAPQVVIKTLTVDPAADPDFVARLKSVTRVSSSYVARTLDAGAENGLSYVVREHVEGRSLAEAVAADGPLTGDALERVAVGMLTALTAVHLAGFAHRGLTPSNVILTAEGPCVTDIELGDPVGELGYRAPEQLNGLQYGPYADVFAWAATVVFAATGAAPFGHDAEQLLNGEPEVGELPEPLRQVVLAALTKDVAGRPTTYTALLRLLGDVNAPMPAPPIAGVPSPPPVAGQQPGPVAPPAIQPIQLSIGAVQTPQMPPPQPPMAAQGPMDQHPMQPVPGQVVPGLAGPGQPGPMDQAPIGSGPMASGPVDQGPVAHGATVPGPMEQGPMEQGPMEQGPMEHGQMGQGPTPPVWGP
ncbi:serine/threonine protein kinase, partial [Nonomuraea basaltis]|uniref:serine/threonine protein kinase n=1 Tax=Nonomuraea basaltis TaxID=2495887 RepID=UPI00148755D3